MSEKFTTIEQYISSFPEEIRPKLQELRDFIKKVAPGVEETIRYNMPTFNLDGTYLVYFAAWKKHISMYPYTTEMEADFPETAEYDTSGKGTIQFPIDKDLPLELIRKIVEYRLRELRQT
ncbi:MAG: iron chaperone [Weeksellaceae bacterium]